MVPGRECLCITKKSFDNKFAMNRRLFVLPSDLCQGRAIKARGLVPGVA
jgi:hypothetical protein